MPDKSFTDAVAAVANLMGKTLHSQIQLSLAMLNLSRQKEVQETGINSFALTRWGVDPSTTSMRVTVASTLLEVLGADTVEGFDWTEFRVLYYAAQSAKRLKFKGLSAIGAAHEACTRFQGLTKSQARDLHDLESGHLDRTDEEMTQVLHNRIPADTANAFLAGIERMAHLTESTTNVSLETIGEFLRNADSIVVNGLNLCASNGWTNIEQVATVFIALRDATREGKPSTPQALSDNSLKEFNHAQAN